MIGVIYKSDGRVKQLAAMKQDFTIGFLRKKIKGNIILAGVGDKMIAYAEDTRRRKINKLATERFAKEIGVNEIFGTVIEFSTLKL